jgi:hypothetical protein
VQIARVNTRSSTQAPSLTELGEGRQRELPVRSDEWAGFFVSNGGLSGGPATALGTVSENPAWPLGISQSAPVRSYLTRQDPHGGQRLAAKRAARPAAFQFDVSSISLGNTDPNRICHPPLH